MSDAQPSGTVTLVFTDVEGSTKLLEELGTDAYRDALGRAPAGRARRIRAPPGLRGRLRGRRVLLRVRHARRHAVSAVSEAMVGLEAGPIRIRVGIHTGEPALDPPKYVGMDVHGRRGS